jgi:hypothetical protein
VRRVKIPNNSASTESTLIRLAAELRKVGIYQPEDYVFTIHEPNLRFGGATIPNPLVRLCSFSSLPGTNIVDFEIEATGTVPVAAGTDLFFDLPYAAKLRDVVGASPLYAIIVTDSIASANPIAGNLAIIPGSIRARARMNSGAAWNAGATFGLWANFRYRTEILTPE